MLARWKLTDLAWSELKRLADDGVAVTPQDVLDIQALSLDALDAADDESSLSTGAPVLVGGKWLYPLTVAASLFVADVCRETESERLQTHVFAYAMANGRSEEKMRERGKKALAASLEFAKTLTCSYSRELEAVLTPYAEMPPGVEDPDADEAVEGGVARVARAAFALIGGSMAAYEYQMSVGAIVALLRHHCRLALAAGGDPATHPRVAELRRLGIRVEEIRARATGGAHGHSH